MNYEQESNTIATYALIQEAINNTSNLIIQVFGFSIAAIISIILASTATKSSYIYFALLIILLLSIYISSQTKSLVEVEAYITVFLEPELDPCLQWRKIINKRNLKGRSSNKRYMFRPPLNFPDFYPFAYGCILIYLLFVVYNITPTTEQLSLETILLAIALIITITVVFVFVGQTTEYSKEKYYWECKEDFEKQKQQEASFKPSQAKLVDSNGKEIFIPKSTYQILLKITEMMASARQCL